MHSPSSPHTPHTVPREKSMSVLPFPTDRVFDLACLGRLAVDFYSQQFGSPLEDNRSMAQYLGGSSANLAFATLNVDDTLSLVEAVLAADAMHPHAPVRTVSCEERRV